MAAPLPSFSDNLESPTQRWRRDWATRARDLAGRVENLGGQAVLLPTVELDAPADWGPVDSALDRLRDYHWLVFTSSNGVASCHRRHSRV